MRPRVCYHPPVTDSKGSQWTVALILFGVLFLGVSDTQLVAPLLPLIAESLETTPGRAGIIVSTYSLAAAAFALFVGPLSDRIGRKKILVIGLVLFACSSFLTYHVSSFSALVFVRAITGLAAGTLSTSALSLAADYYPYGLRGRAMGILSMGYFVAFIVGVPVGAFVAAYVGWRAVFGGLAVLGVLMLVPAAGLLPSLPTASPRHVNRNQSMLSHFGRPNQLAGILAAFLTSGGLVGFLTYAGAWLNTTHNLSIERIGLIFMASGAAGVAASPVSGWLSDHASKRGMIIWANIVLSLLFVIVARVDSVYWLIIGLAALSISASARQGPLHALTTEIVGTEMRGSYIAIRNAASQIGIAAVAWASAYAFDSGGFIAVALIASGVTLLIPLCCVWLKEPTHQL